jgi:hypothetical protein
VRPRPLAVAPPEGGRLTVELPPASWTMIRLAGTAD